MLLFNTKLVLNSLSFESWEQTYKASNIIKHSNGNFNRDLHEKHIVNQIKDVLVDNFFAKRTKGIP